ncbi:MAG: hypothetical protein ACI86M_001945 [Saprospiraceae bacterium]|jgi:hypothetical protein
MNSKFYFLLTAFIIIIISCKSDIKSDAKPIKREKSSTESDDGPDFKMADKPISSIKVTEADTIDINSIAEIVSKANHNTALRLKKGKYELPENLVYYISKDKKEIVDKNVVDTRSVGGQVFITGMTNFSIIGNGSEILSKNPKAIPLFILNIYQCEFKNLTLGHKLSSKAPSIVPSLYVSRSSTVNFSNCMLGNNSKSGLKINDSKFITFADCSISKSHSQIMEIYQGKSLQFVNSIFNNNECAFGCFSFLGTENSIEFKNVIVNNNRYIGEKSNNFNQLITGPFQNIKFNKSKFQNNTNFSQIGIDDINLADCEVQKF